METRQDGFSNGVEHVLDRGAHMSRLILLLVFLISAVGCSRTVDLGTVPPVEDIVEPDSRPNLVCAGSDGARQIMTGQTVSVENVSFLIDNRWIRDVEHFVTPECILNRDDIRPDGAGARTLTGSYSSCFRASPGTVNISLRCISQRS